jgi:putative aldouronate transport system permease protein
MDTPAVSRRAPGRVSGFFRAVRRDRQLLLIMAPALVHIFIFCYLPIYGISISFRNYRIGDPFFALGSAANWVGVAHFLEFFRSIFFARLIRNTILLNVLTFVFSFWVPIAFALLLNEIRPLRYKRLVQSFSYLPYFVSAVIIVSIAMNILAKDGVVNTIIQSLGGEATYFLGKPVYFRPLYVGLNVWKTFGWNAIIYLAAIANVSPELYQAARVDGANRWSQMVHVTLPGIMPTILMLLILNMGTLFASNTELILLITTPNNLDVADVIGTYTYRMGVVEGQFSYATAIGFFAAVANFILLWIVNWIVRRGTNEGLW